jgi:hypothetical protein
MLRAKEKIHQRVQILQCGHDIRRVCSNFWQMVWTKICCILCQSFSISMYNVSTAGICFFFFSADVDRQFVGIFNEVVNY